MKGNAAFDIVLKNEIQDNNNIYDLTCLFFSNFTKKQSALIVERKLTS